MLLRKFSWEKLHRDLSYKNIIVFGAGGALKNFLYFMQRINIATLENIEYIVDNDEKKWGKNITISNKMVEIVSPRKFLSIYNKNKVLIIASQFLEDIMKQLSAHIELQGVYFYDDIKVCVCEHEYDIPKSFKRCSKQIIPKVLHYCWFGRKKLPDQYIEWMKSWKKFCSDYEIVEWNEDNYDYHKNQYMSEAYQAGKWGFVSDYARLDIVNTYGGIYLDTDVELVRNLDELLYQPAFFGIHDDGRCNTGLGFGAEAGFPLLQLLMSDYEDRRFIKGNDVMDLTVCPAIQTATLERLGYEKINKYQIVENASFLPAPILGGFIGTELCMKNESFSIHHAAWSWRDNIGGADAILKGRMVKSEKMWRESAGI